LTNQRNGFAWLSIVLQERFLFDQGGKAATVLE